MFLVVYYFPIFSTLTPVKLGFASYFRFFLCSVVAATVNKMCVCVCVCVGGGGGGGGWKPTMKRSACMYRHALAITIWCF